jgi:hypothetical protein
MKEGTEAKPCFVQVPVMPSTQREPEILIEKGEVKFLLGVPYPHSKLHGITGVPARPLSGLTAKIGKLHAMIYSEALLSYSRGKPRGIKPYRLRLIKSKMRRH